MEVSMVKRYGLRDNQFARIENLLPGRPGHVGRNSEGGNHSAEAFAFSQITDKLRSLDEFSDGPITENSERQRRIQAGNQSLANPFIAKGFMRHTNQPIWIRTLLPEARKNSFCPFGKTEVTT